MCDPITGAALAMTAAGVGANAIGAGQTAGAQNRVMSAEQRRQDTFRNKSGASAGDTIEGVSRPAQDALSSAAFKDRGPAYTAPIGQPQFISPIDPSNPAIAGEFGRAGGRQRTMSLAEALAKAKLDAFGDANLRTGFWTAHNAQDISFNSGASRESSSLVPLELQNAQRTGGGMRMLGDVLTAGGSLAGAGAFNGLFNPTFAATANLPAGYGGGGMGLFKSGLY